MGLKPIFMVYCPRLRLPYHYRTEECKDILQNAHYPCVKVNLLTVDGWVLGYKWSLLELLM